MSQANPNNVTELKTARRVRSIWISDVHLGFSGCSADYLIEFLRAVHCDTLYLVGDIIDFWALKRKPYWPQSHNNVVRCILGKAKHDTRVVFVPGNHDEVLRDYDGLRFGNIEIADTAIHTTVDGRRLLVIHGDQFDCVVKHSRALALLGTFLYEVLLRLNGIVNWVRRKFHRDYWSLAAFLKHKVKNAMQYIGRYEQVLADEAKRRGVHGIVCGHIHRPELSRVGTIEYLNCGDWVESCTALVERDDGVIELLRWTERKEVVKTLDVFASPAVKAVELNAA